MSDFLENNYDKTQNYYDIINFTYTLIKIFLRYKTKIGR